MPLALTDDELRIVMDAARPLPPHDRGAFLRAVAEELAKHRELGPGVAEALARTAELVRDDNELLDRLAAEASRTAEGLGGTDTLDCEALEAQPPALRRRIIRLWLLTHGLGDLSLRHISAVESLVIDWHGQKAIQIPGATVTRTAGRLRVN